jgi:hypothetical protein
LCGAALALVAVTAAARAYYPGYPYVPFQPPPQTTWTPGPYAYAPYPPPPTWPPGLPPFVPYQPPQQAAWPPGPYGGFVPNTTSTIIHPSAYDPYRPFFKTPGNTWTFSGQYTDSFGRPVNTYGEYWRNPVTGQVYGEGSATAVNPDGSTSTGRSIQSNRRGNGNLPPGLGIPNPLQR